MRLVDYNVSWKELGYELPAFDVQKVKKHTHNNPTWLHIGAGNIFRAFPALLQQKLLNENQTDTGIIVYESFDREIIEKAYRPYNELSLVVILKADGEIEKKVVASVTESITVDEEERLANIMKNPSLQMVSFTITEKGYALKNNQNEYIAMVERDFEKTPQEAEHLMGKMAYNLYMRYQSGKKPLAMLSMDNCSHNGDKLKEAIMTYAITWCENGMCDKEFITYLEEQVTFPWSMIDKITPRPDAKVADMLKGDGFLDVDMIMTEKNTYTAPFVNAEECEYLVIEDCFPNGRPPLEKAGVYFTKREVVDQVERMKVCTCLNPLHTALAIFGCLLGYRLISEEMKNPILAKMVRVLGYKEGMPVVTNPEIIKPDEFLEDVLTKRLPNPFMPDAPQRIATDTSQKLAIRFGETLKEYKKRNLSTEELVVIPLVFAGYLRYLMGVDDYGNKMELSSDPMLWELRTYVDSIELGNALSETQTEKIRQLLMHEALFGVNLNDYGLLEKIIEMFKGMVKERKGISNMLLQHVTATHCCNTLM